MTDVKQAEDGEVQPKSHMTSQWFSFQKQKSVMFYILGPVDEEAIKPIEQEEGDEEKELTPEEEKKIEDQKLDNMNVHYGKLEVDPRVLSEIYQEVMDLVDKMIASEKLSEA